MYGLYAFLLVNGLIRVEAGDCGPPTLVLVPESVPRGLPSAYVSYGATWSSRGLHATTTRGGSRDSELRGIRRHPGMFSPFGLLWWLFGSFGRALVAMQHRRLFRSAMPQ